MRAMSLGLIKGVIDEVDQVSISFRTIFYYNALLSLQIPPPRVSQKPSPNTTCTHLITRPFPQVVTVSWVQPRVLSQPQIATLAGRLEGWAQKVQETLTYVEDQTPELFN